MSKEVPDFNALSEAEQREVASRLLKIEQSGWRPFWCPDAHCDGFPHWKTDDDGDAVFVPVGSEAGASGEPLDVDPEWGYPEGYVDEYGRNWGIPVLDPAWAHNHAREDQRLPSWVNPWVLFIMSGRGAGKTTTGVEFVTLSARKGLDGAILGRRGTELVNTHVATILARAHPDFTPVHWASKDLLEWPNGAITYLFSAEKPENIRSVNLSYAWVDEAAFMDEIETAWMNLKLATRIEVPGNPIHFLITSTPTPTKWVMRMEDDEDVIIRRVSTYSNKANLSKSFMADLEKNFEGTRIGRQELHGEVLRDVEGAMWSEDIIQHMPIEDREEFLETLDDIVIAVDPAGSKGPKSDATGIVVVGRRDNSDGPGNSRFYVLGDATLKGSPTEWVTQVFKAAQMFNVRRIIVERNFGGDMVKQTLTDYAKLNPTKVVDASGMEFRFVESRAVQGKDTRAEPVVGRYEQGRVWHCPSPGLFGDLSELEKEQLSWVPKSRGGKSPSPNRVDALVWAMTNLQRQVTFSASTATPADIRRLMKKR